MRIRYNFNETYEPEKNAEKFNMSVNPKAYVVATVLEKLGANQTQFGKPYCPCMPSHNEATVCPCRYMREMKACRCGLYVRMNESEE